MGSISTELRQAVLQSAMQGKLTEQLSEDGNARNLLKQIKLEKERLIKEKKIKKEKELAPITEDEIPFDIPDSWEWAYIGDIFEHNAGKALNSKNTKGSKHKYITTSNVYWDHFELDNLKEMYYTDDEVEKYSVKKGDLLVLEGGDVGRTAIWDLDVSYCVQNHVHRLRPYVNIVVKYFYYCMMYFKNAGMVNGKGIAIQGLSANALHIIVVPLPPLAEQKRIVAHVEELMAKIDELEVIENNLRELHQAFPNDMKASLLQSAMQGKLTEQLSEDGDARVLLEQIKEEKERLIKEKKVKKERALAPITEDEIPFDIPDNWEWCRFGSIVNYNMGKTPPRKEEEWWGNDFPWVSISDMVENGHVSTVKEKVSNKSIGTIFKNISKVGTMLMSFKLTVGRVSILDIDAVHNEAIISIYPYVNSENIMRDYLFKILPFVTQWGDSKNAIKGKTLNDTSISNLMIPLPPLAEQKRIVEKLDRLLPLCDSLQNEL